MYIDILYDVEKNEFQTTSDMPEEEIYETVMNFLISKFGMEVDYTPSTNYDIYKIRLEYIDNIIKCTHNCGNRILREGILLEYYGRLKEKLNIH